MTCAKKKRSVVSQMRRSASGGGGFMSSFVSFVKDQIATEVQALEALNRRLFEEIHTLRQREARVEFAGTKLGILFNYLGYFFSGYCIYKLVMASVNIVFNRVARVDPVTRWLGIVLSWLNFNVDIELWSQYVSFILVGILIATSVRGFLNLWLQIFRLQNAAYSLHTAAMYVLFMAWIMGMYFVSSVLLLRMSMPLKYRCAVLASCTPTTARQSITDVLGEIQFKIYHQWFDFIFLVSALLTMAVFYLAERGNNKEPDQFA